MNNWRPSTPLPCGISSFRLPLRRQQPEKCKKKDPRGLMLFSNIKKSKGTFSLTSEDFDPNYEENEDQCSSTTSEDSEDWEDDVFDSQSDECGTSDTEETESEVSSIEKMRWREWTSSEDLESHYRIPTSTKIAEWSSSEDLEFKSRMPTSTKIAECSKDLLLESQTLSPITGSTKRKTSMNAVDLEFGDVSSIPKKIDDAYLPPVLSPFESTQVEVDSGSFISIDKMSMTSLMNSSVSLSDVGKDCPIALGSPITSSNNSNIYKHPKNTEYEMAINETFSKRLLKTAKVTKKTDDNLMLQMLSEAESNQVELDSGSFISIDKISTTALMNSSASLSDVCNDYPTAPVNPMAPSNSSNSYKHSKSIKYEIASNKSFSKRLSQNLKGKSVSKLTDFHKKKNASRFQVHEDECFRVKSAFHKEAIPICTLSRKKPFTEIETRSRYPRKLKGLENIPICPLALSR